MSTDVAERPELLAPTVIDVLARGDLKGLTAEQRVEHYTAVCRSLGLNPLTQPFQYITLNGKLQLYARKDACDQLRKVNGINIAIPSYQVSDGLLTVHARAVDKTGRSDEDYGVVSVAGLKGEAAANAFLKCVTKAKRRVTLSISGLGLLDESDAFEEGSPVFIRTPELRGDELRQAGGAQVDLRQPPTGEVSDKIEPHEIDRADNDAQAWSTWATRLMAFVRAAPDANTINEWTTANAEHLAALQQHDSGKYRRLIDMIDHQVAMRAEDGS